MLKKRFAPATLMLAFFLAGSCLDEKPNSAEPPESSGLSLVEGYRIVEYMTESCPWCHKLEASLQKLGATVEGGLDVEYVYLDKDEDRLEEARKAGLKNSVPFLAVFDGDGEVVTTIGGYAPPDALKEQFVEAGVLK